MDRKAVEGAGTHLFVSPHLDDAAVSCGAQIIEMVDWTVPVMVLTIFAGDPPPHSHSPDAVWFHAVCGLGEDPVGTRRREDVRAMQILGAQTRHLGFPDCLYRLDSIAIPFVQEARQLLTSTRHPDGKLVAHVATELHAIAGHTTLSTLHVPLGVGRNIDHLVVRAAAELFIQETRPSRRPKLIYYEDLPYASRDIDPTWQYELTHGLNPRLHRIREDAWSRKVTAIGAYQSQMTLLRGPDEDLEEELHRYAIEIGDRSMAERSWQPVTQD